MVHGLLTFLRNRYLWVGLGLLVAVGLAIYLTFDRVIMPSMTRHGSAVTVPDVMALTPENAESALALVGLSMQQQMLRKLNLPINEVIDQRPPAGALVKPGRSIYVTINTGDTTTVVVPLVVGRSRRDVSGLLGQMGLRLGTVQEDSVRSSFPRDVVTRQLPGSGTRRPRQTPIQIWYSAGPSAAFVIVPDVSGMRVEDARERLRGAGLRSVILGSNDQMVRDQGPAAGTTVREGSEVRLRTRGANIDGETDNE